MAPLPGDHRGTDPDRGRDQSLAWRLRQPVVPAVKWAQLQYGTATAGLRVLPDFLVIGTKRGGSTSLYRNLVRTPGVLGLFPRRADVIDRYRVATGFDLSDYPFYEAFSWWKQGCIVEGVHARRLQGSQGGMRQTGPASEIAAQADMLLDRAHALVHALD